jgi:phage terminase large subunit
MMTDLKDLQIQEKIIDWNPSSKQYECLKLLRDRVHTEIFYGGGAGGGKSYLGCAWLILNCIKYPGSRWLMGRAILKSLKESTLLTFLQICRSWGLIPGEHYKYNPMEGVIRFPNESSIYLKDLFLYPSDPEFDSLGSTEYTGAFIDEASQITAKAKNIVMSRIRYKLDEFGLIPKLLIASNPSKNFLYFEFYKPWKEEKIEPYRAFTPALVGDNPFISKHYIENLKKLDRISKERLLYGNFEYDDDPTRLFSYDAIVDLFTNNAEKGQKYCTVDVAGRGRDRTVIIIWDGWFIEKIILKDNISSDELDKILIEKKIPRSKCAIDEDGVGFGLVKNLSGVKGFVNNAQPIKNKKETDREKSLRNYRNLKAQCWFELANYVNTGQIGIYRDVPLEVRELITEDLEQIKQKDPGKDVPLTIISKEEIKESLGRSTDVGDAMMMRMFFVLRPPLAFDFV